MACSTKSEVTAKSRCQPVGLECVLHGLDKPRARPSNDRSAPPPLIPRPNDDYRAASRHSPCLTVQKRLDRERRQRDCRKGYTAVIVVVLIDAVVLGLMAMRGSNLGGYRSSSVGIDCSITTALDVDGPSSDSICNLRGVTRMRPVRGR